MKKEENSTEFEMLVQDLRLSKENLEDLESYYQLHKMLILNDIKEAEEKLKSY